MSILHEINTDDPDLMERIRRALARAFRTGNVLRVSIEQRFDPALRNRYSPQDMFDPVVRNRYISRSFEDAWEVKILVEGRPVEDPDPDKLPYSELEAMQARLTERLQMVERAMMAKRSADE